MGGAYINARPMTQTVDELMPCRNLATSMTQSDLASMNMTRKPTSARRPSMKGARREVNFSESHEMGGVAASTKESASQIRETKTTPTNYEAKGLSTGQIYRMRH